MRVTRDALLLLILLAALPACSDVPDDDLDEGETAAAESACLEDNALVSNAINPNAINPNAINPNALSASALSTSTLSTSSLSALQDPDTAGDLSRMLIRYLVSCAFNTSQSFSFSWTDRYSNIHQENYPGLLGLAPDWATMPLSVAGQRWVSACIASRVNWYGTTVTISSRSAAYPIKQLDTWEKGTYTYEEGAFWGNIFGPTPWLRACNIPANVSHSRQAYRDCAAGHLESGVTSECGIVHILGSCDTVCDRLDPQNLFHPKCIDDPAVSSSTMTPYVFTVFLP